MAIFSSSIGYNGLGIIFDETALLSWCSEARPACRRQVGCVATQ